MKRPFVLFNAAVSLDGKLAPASRRKVRLGSDRDRARMDVLRAGSDAILIGAATLRAEDPPLQVRTPAGRRHRTRQGRTGPLLEVLVSRTLRIPSSSRFLRDDAIPPGPGGHAAGPVHGTVQVSFRLARPAELHGVLGAGEKRPAASWMKRFSRHL